jgi:hypothetical protein
MEGEIHFCKQMLLAENVWLRKNLEATAKEYDEALGKIARLQVDLHQTVVDYERCKKALRQISQGAIEPGHLYLQATRMQDIAREALQG